MAMLSSTSQKTVSYKALIGVGLTTAMLTLGACSKKEEPPVETETTVTTTTPAVTESDTATATAPDMAGDDMGANDEVGMASADGTATTTEPMTDGMNNNGMASGDTATATDDVGVATADDSAMMDGTDTNEHISTN